VKLDQTRARKRPSVRRRDDEPPGIHPELFARHFDAIVEVHREKGGTTPNLAREETVRRVRQAKHSDAFEKICRRPNYVCYGLDDSFEP
jgi:hypothetical protein